MAFQRKSRQTNNPALQWTPPPFISIAIIFFYLYSFYGRKLKCFLTLPDKVSCLPSGTSQDPRSCFKDTVNTDTVKILTHIQERWLTPTHMVADSDLFGLCIPQASWMQSSSGLEGLVPNSHDNKSILQIPAALPPAQLHTFWPIKQN